MVFRFYFVRISQKWCLPSLGYGCRLQLEKEKDPSLLARHGCRCPANKTTGKHDGCRSIHMVARRGLY